jgi:hypothetical protein
MKHISKVFLRDDNKILISSINGEFWFDLNLETYGHVVYRRRSSGPESLSKFSKEELLKYQYILLNAYVYLHDTLEKGIVNNVSKNDLDNYKTMIFTIRKILMIYTNYIDEYDELVKNYKDI